MDNSSVRRWGPPFPLVILGWIGTAGALWWSLAGTSNASGRLFAGLAVLVLAVCSLYGTRARPRLAASSTGIEVRGMAMRRAYRWTDVSEMRLLHTPGLGRRSLTLEITAGSGDDEQLLIFGRLDLGSDPREVYDELSELQPEPDGHR